MEAGPVRGEVHRGMDGRLAAAGVASAFHRASGEASHSAGLAEACRSDGLVAAVPACQAEEGHAGLGDHACRAVAHRLAEEVLARPEVQVPVKTRVRRGVEREREAERASHWVLHSVYLLNM